jgi:hypothetical protein
MGLEANNGVAASIETACFEFIDGQIFFFTNFERHMAIFVCTKKLLYARNA